MDGTIRQQPPAASLNKAPRFISLSHGNFFETTVMEGDVYRPIVSENHNFRNIRFTVDDKYVVTDIRYDAKWFYLAWEDDL